MPATLTDVAARAEVSLATASRAFNDPDRLAPATRQRVLAAAAELGYETPMGPATRTIGVVVPDMANAVFASLLRSIHDQAWHGRHQLMVTNTNEDPSREREALDRLAGSTNGIILCSPRSPVDQLDTFATRTPMVVVNGMIEKAPCVLIGANDGIRQAVEHLRALGHQHLAYVPGPASSWADRNRQDALSERCAAEGLQLTVVGNQAASVSGGLAAAASVVASGATAVVAYNDLVALGVRAGAQSLGRLCPQHLSVIGIDDLDVSAVSDPALTSVHVGIAEGGTLAVDLLLEQIDGSARHDDAVHMGSQLIVRGSTGVPETVHAT
ncbi:LacI family DNA-binding transcriptional regulator [Saccharopolyspora mangrovi]|uniref:LacI family DNA-binding transcriptional regulator n=1 Tax=Saccharopolyspora mangrovi TaxID=3082379 RepID=A0ABU6ALM7_9PSEU|nr:LacI family DNA-binding transcriptional regulator [Saccharopolyspora sp. S2-29]MEB3372423.1 LacI family DNA-binding transcriptional regulator [Saccharopolyspora sp. S2-29]